MKSWIKGMWITCLFYPLAGFGQNEIDALRYSQQTFGSTARSLSMGGAFGALGADFSTLSFNPAGIGVYRKSEFSISMGFANRNSEATYLGETEDDSRFNVSMPNLGLVFALTKDKDASPWKQFGFGLGYNRLNSFQTNYSFSGINTENSLPDSYADQVYNDGGAHPDDLYYYYPFGADLAYQTFLLDTISGFPNYYYSIIPNGGTRQTRSFESRGSMGEFLLSFGGNYNDKIYFGVTLGFPSLRYEENVTWEETDTDNSIITADSVYDFRSLRYTSYLKTTGRGVNGKFGIIIRPADFIRIGAAIHTPTYFYMSDGYHSEMASVVNNSPYYMESPLGNYNYSLTTPFKAIGSLAFIFGKSGVLSLDYEYTDYTDAHLHASDYSFSTENRTIDKLYNSSVHIFKAGTEWKYEDLSFRAGAAYYSPAFDHNLKADKDIDQHMISYTGGLGYRGDHFYTDIGYAWSQTGELVRPYSLSTETVPGATIKHTEHRVILTVGLRF